MENNKKTFEQNEIAGIKFNNRILRAATFENMADEAGNPTEKLISLYEILAKGGVGGIITGYMGVSEDGRAEIPGMVMIEKDSRVDSLRKLTDRIHKLNTPIICQIAHCGKNGVSKKTFNVNKISENTINRVIDDFVKAANRAMQSGFDGVEIHMAHGYFLSEMLSAHTNKRRDKWGGSIENRTRVIKEIMKRVRTLCPNYPIFAKINGDEIYKDGIHANEAVEISRILEESGVNAIEVSCGINWKEMGPAKGNVPVPMILKYYPGLNKIPKPLHFMAKPLVSKVMKNSKTTVRYNINSAKRIKENVKIPVIAVGGIHDLIDIEKTIEKDEIDFVSISRPLIIEPGLIKKYENNDTNTSKCLSCNYCLIGLYHGPLKCYYGKCDKQ